MRVKDPHNYMVTAHGSCVKWPLDSWYDLWMRVEGPHNYMVTALGSCVKWSLDNWYGLWMRVKGPRNYMVMFGGHLDYFKKPPLGGRLITKTGRPWHSKYSQPLIYS